MESKRYRVDSYTRGIDYSQPAHTIIVPRPPDLPDLFTAEPADVVFEKRHLPRVGVQAHGRRFFVFVDHVDRVVYARHYYEGLIAAHFIEADQ